jgi:hypothetical protein
MSQVFELDNVIRLVKNPDEGKNNLHGGKIIRLNFNKGEILYKKKLLDFNRDIRYYWVSTYNRAENAAECSVKDFSTGNAIIVKIKYEVNCPPGNEEKVVLALYKGSHPGAALNELIEGWVFDFTDAIKRKGGNPVLDYFNYSQDLKEALRERVSRCVGLNSDFLLTLKYEDELKTSTINSNYFSVRVKDCDEELNLKFETGLAVNQKSKIYAILNYTRFPEIEGLFTECIQKFVLEHISLHDFIYNLNGSVKEKLTGILNDTLLEKGRQIAWINFETSIASTFPPQTKKIHHQVECDIKSHACKIKIHHKLLIQLEDLGKYKATKISKEQDKDSKDKAIDDLVREKLDIFTQNILFDKTYVDILLDFEQEEDRQEILTKIKKDMQDYLESIGYSVKHLMVEPNEEPLIWKRDGFLVEVKDEDYPTQDSRVNVRLAVVARGKLKDLRKIAKYIIPTNDIKENMKRVIREEIQKQMHEVDPEEYYMPINFTDREPVVERLRRIVKEKLGATFFAEEVFVTIKPVENDLVDRLQKLKEGNPHLFEIKVLPQLDSGHTEEVGFEVEFVILTVNKDGWQPFLSKKFDSPQEEIEKIKQTLTLDLTEKFQDVPAHILLGNDVEMKKKLKEKARDSHSKIAAVFGLDIFISLIKRKATKLEEANLAVRYEQIELQKEKEKDMIKKAKDADLRDLYFLRQKKSELIDPDCPDGEALKEVNQRISEIMKTSAHPENAGQKLLKPVKKDAELNWSFDQFEDEFANKALPSKKAQPIERKKQQEESKNE